ncbi:phosphatases II, partial [Mollisia scopiformis]
MIQVIPNLHISNYPTTIPKTITHILTMCTKPLSRRLSKGVTTLHLPLHNQDDITPHIPQILTFIATALAVPNNHVLVHCREGVNRSSAAVIAYLCSKNGSNAADAFMELYMRKTDICTRRRFLEQIDGWFGGGGEYKEDDVSREVCDRVEKLRLGWMLQGYFIRPTDWVWMQKGGPWEGKDDGVTAEDVTEIEEILLSIEPSEDRESAVVVEDVEAIDKVLSKESQEVLLF